MKYGCGVRVSLTMCSSVRNGWGPSVRSLSSQPVRIERWTASMTRWSYAVSSVTVQGRNGQVPSTGVSWPLERRHSVRRSAHRRAHSIC